MSKWRAFQIKSQVTVRDVPAVGQFAAADPSAFLLIDRFKSGVGILPGRGIGLRQLFRGRAGAIESYLAKSLQTPAVAEIDELVLIQSEHADEF